jgi:hypothetical protein
MDAREPTEVGGGGNLKPNRGTDLGALERFVALTHADVAAELDGGPDRHPLDRSQTASELQSGDSGTRFNSYAAVEKAVSIEAAVDVNPIVELTRQLKLGLITHEEMVRRLNTFTSAALAAGTGNSTVAPFDDENYSGSELDRDRIYGSDGGATLLAFENQRISTLGRVYRGWGIGSDSDSPEASGAYNAADDAGTRVTGDYTYSDRCIDEESD